MYLLISTLDINYYTVSVALLIQMYFASVLFQPAMMFFIGDEAVKSWYLSLFLLLTVAHHRVTLSGFFVHHLKQIHTFVLTLNL